MNDATWRDLTYNVLRVATGLMFMQHGAQKLFGWLDGRQVTELTSVSGVAGVLEFFGGALIALGLLTRPVAFILSGEMAVAYFWRHLPNGFWPILNRGEIAALFSFLFLFIAAHGPGTWSLDALIRRRNVSPGKA